MNFSDIHDHTSRSVCKEGLAPVKVIAAGGGDGTANKQTAFDRRTLGGLDLSAAVLVPYSSSIATSETATIVVKFQHSSTTVDGDFTDLTATDGATSHTISITDADEHGVLRVAYDLAPAKRYLRVVATPDCSASGTDFVTYAAVVEFSGSDHQPAS